MQKEILLPPLTAIEVTLIETLPEKEVLSSIDARRKQDKYEQRREHLGLAKDATDAECEEAEYRRAEVQLTNAIELMSPMLPEPEPEPVPERKVQLIRTRLNCNMLSVTLEKLLQHRKKQVQELVEVVQKDFEEAGKDADMHKREETRKNLTQLITDDPPEQFNDNAHLTERMREVLNLLPTFGDQIGRELQHESHLSGLVTIGGDSNQDGCFATCSWAASGKKDSFGAVRVWKLNKDKMYDREERTVSLCTAENRWQQPLSITWLFNHRQLAVGLFDGTIALIPVNTVSGQPSSATERFVGNDSRGTNTDRPITAIAAQPVGASTDQLLVAGTMSGELLLFSHEVTSAKQSSSGEILAQPTLVLRDSKTGCREQEVHNQDWQRHNKNGNSNDTSNPMYHHPPEGESLAHTHHHEARDGHFDAVRMLSWVNQELVVSGSFDRRLLVWRVDPTTTKLSIAGKLFDPDLHRSRRKDMSMKSTIDLSSSHDSEQSPVAAHDDALAHDKAITALVTFCCVTGTYPNGTSTACVASTAEDLKIKIWRLPSSPDTRCDILQSEQPGREYDVGETLLTLERVHKRGICSMAWLHWPEGPEGPEGWLATGSNDNSIKIIDLDLAGVGSGWMVMKVLRGHEGAVHGLSWLPCQGWLLSGSKDGTVRTWRLRGASDEDVAVTTSAQGVADAKGSARRRPTLKMAAAKAIQMNRMAVGTRGVLSMRGSTSKKSVSIRSISQTSSSASKRSLSKRSSSPP